jgi:hypothetical protein
MLARKSTFEAQVFHDLTLSGIKFVAHDLRHRAEECIGQLSLWSTQAASGTA